MAVLQTFTFVGSQQSFVVPVGVTRLGIRLGGAQGMSAQTAGGGGGVVEAVISVTPGETLYVNCGGRNGYNGGGALSGYAPPQFVGGGMTDVRQGGTGTANIVVVAGGGGAGGYWSPGGAGGNPGLDGQGGAAVGGGATQSSGGVAGGPGATPGAAFVGGIGSATSGSGGSGYYGGGGAGNGSGGGGGSSWAIPAASNVLYTTGSWFSDGYVQFFTPQSTAPILLTPVSGANVAPGSLTLGWQYQQSGSGTVQTGWCARRKIGAGAYGFWNGTDWSSPSVFIIYSSGQSAATTGWVGGNTYAWSVFTVDANGSSTSPPDSVVTVVAAPTVAVTAPTGTKNTDPTAHIAWTPTTTVGQVTWRAIVYTAAQYGAGGFTPGVGPSAWDSGLQGGNGTAGDSLPLPNATYRAYVQIGQVGGQVSAWAYSAFTINCTPPATPTLTATLDSPNARTTLVATAAASGQRVSIQSSDDGGATWQAVRFATGLATGAGNAVTVYDYEAPPGATRQYRAQAATALLVPSAWSATATAATVRTDYWLKDPLDPTANMKIRIYPGGHSPVQRQAVSSRPTLGRKYAFVTMDSTMGGEDGSLSIIVQDDATYRQLMAPPTLTSLGGLLMRQRTLLLQSPFNEQWYVVVVGDITSPLTSDAFPGTPVRQVSFPYAEQAVP